MPKKSAKSTKPMIVSGGFNPMYLVPFIPSATKVVEPVASEIGTALGNATKKLRKLIGLGVKRSGSGVQRSGDPIPVLMGAGKKKKATKKKTMKK